MTAPDIIGEWASVKLPPVPELKPVTVDPKTTALLVLDMMKGNCGARPRCLATVATVKTLIDAARAANMMVVYNLTGAGKVEDMVDQSLAPRAGEFMVKGSGGADKFVNSNLDAGLKDKGIKTVIVTGTSAQGAVVHHHKWRGAARLQGGGAGRRHVGGGRLQRALRRVAHRQGRPGQPHRQRHGDTERFDYVRELTTQATRELAQREDSHVRSNAHTHPFRHGHAVGDGARARPGAIEAPGLVGTVDAHLRRQSALRPDQADPQAGSAAQARVPGAVRG